jgi:tetratricopeptide (TPR) repeat protein
MNPLPTVSLCMIVRNEAQYLRECLESVRGIVSETIVVDTGSTDGTREIATALGARIVEFTWAQDFSLARNCALSEATGKWILVLDADERLQPEHREKLAELLRSEAEKYPEPCHAFSLLQNSVIMQGSSRSSLLVSIIRLFPNRPEIRYTWPIHEQVADSLGRAGIPVLETSIEIHHLGYASPETNREKQKRNLALLEKQTEAGHHGHPISLFLLAGAYLDLGRFEDALAAYDRCMTVAPEGSDVANGAAVRKATCLARLRKFEAAAAYLNLAGAAIAHPELASLQGESYAALGRRDEARQAYENVLMYQRRAYIPPCNLDFEKTKALVWLGGYWKDKGQRQLALELMRAAQALHQHGEPFELERLAQMYRAAGVG